MLFEETSLSFENGTFVPPPDRSLNCSSNIGEPKSGREGLWPKPTRQSFLEIWEEEGSTLDTPDGLPLDRSGKWNHTICGCLRIHLLLQA